VAVPRFRRRARSVADVQARGAFLMSCPVQAIDARHSEGADDHSAGAVAQANGMPRSLINSDHPAVAVEMINLVGVRPQQNA
jgi:hypothetical protein